MVPIYVPQSPFVAEGLIEFARRLRRLLCLVLAGIMIGGALTPEVRADSTGGEQQKLPSPARVPSC
jgi:hypothetical protein